MHQLNDGSLVGEDQLANVAEVVRKSLSVPGQAVAIPAELSEKLNAALTKAVLPEVLALRERERTVSTEALRMTLR